MEIVLHILVFLVSCALLCYAGQWLVGALNKIAKFLGWKEFVVAFFSIAFAASAPELFIGIISALQGIPEASFGNIVGANIIHFTLAVALCAFVLKNIVVESRTVQAGSVFAVIASILPFLLLFDGILGRGDGVILILSFVIYTAWLFSKKERFVKTYDDMDEQNQKPIMEQWSVFLKNFVLMFVSIIFLIIASNGIIRSSVFFAEIFELPLIFVSILIIGAGTALPETYFTAVSAKLGNSWMLIGALMGCVAVTATLILGIVAIIHPIVILEFNPFAISRAFLIISAIFFLIFVKTHQKVSYKEGLILLSLYILFVITLLLFS